MEVPCGEGQTSPQEDTDNGPCRPTPQYPVQHASIPLQPSPNAGPYFAQQYAFANMVGPQFGQPFQGFVSADSPFQQQPQYHTIPLDDRTNFQHGPYPAFNPLGMHQSSSFRTPPRYAAGNEAVKKTGRSSDPAAKLPQEDDDKSSDEDEDLTEVLCGQPAARGGGAKGSNALNTAKTGPGSLTAKKLEVAARVRAEKAAAKEAKRTAAAAKKAEEGPKQKGRGKKKGGDGEGDAGGDGAAGGGGSSHWSRTELGQCISLRCELHPKFTQMGSQQEHWNKIALKMASLGYSR